MQYISFKSTASTPAIKYVANLRYPIRQVLGVVFVLFMYSCKNTTTPKAIATEHLIPIPVAVALEDRVFTITASTAIYIDESSEALMASAEYLAALVRPSTGFDIPIKTAHEQLPKGSMHIKLNTDGTAQAPEGYTIDTTEDVLTLEASYPEGIFRGLQTLRQLLPSTIERKTPQEGPWEIAVGTITDYPKYPYRGAMLDVSRHFFSVEDIKRFIDLIAAYKLNVLHLHLSDDQGWRIEITSWPKLTTYGGSTQVGGAAGGYYTQEEYKTIVAYAQSRYITVIPEIDMPGHTHAALASYPELNCNGKAPELYTGTEVGFSSLCVNKEITYRFIDDVIRELAAITPGPYIHIGGDESHATEADDYILFIDKVQDIVKKHGKIMIGWDEVQHATLHPESIAQFWASEENARGAVQKGAKIIMSPASKAYMDMQYHAKSPLGLHWAGYVEVDTAYDWNPSEYVKGISKSHIIGIEAPLWTETITTMKDIEYMAFPRLPGYAEIGWSQDSLRSWTSYKERLANHYKRFRAMNINFYESEKVLWKK